MTRKLSVLSRVSSLAIAAALTASAAGQSLLGDPTVTFGSVNITEGAGTTDFDVLSTTAVIDWIPDDNAIGGGAIAFQNSGTTATYASASDFAVLNRINVADSGRSIFMNGTINSLVNGNTGGSIYFYSPSGFVIGSSAVINVGNLVLTASPLAVDGNGNFLQGTTATFTQAPNPNAAVTTVAGSQITALNEGSYVALVAPRVEHHGAINVNGAAALVGAEAATINFRAGGLFDIQVDVGTTDANGVDVDGTITGPASGGFGDNHRAYLVAVPKNTALTLLIGSGADLGFDIAQSADVIGNAVVLSAGHDISFGDTNSGPSSASGADANINIGNASFTSALYGRADGDAVASSVSGSLTFASDASLRGRDLAKLEAGGDGNVSVGGNLTLSANASGSTEGASATAGNVTLQAFGGGTLSVTGNTTLSAIGTGGFSSTEGLASGDGTGGTILVQGTTGGDVSLGGALNADATGRGGHNDAFGVDSGDGYGGTVNVFASGGGTLSVTGATQLTADGEAGSPSECISCGAIGGIGDAGTVNVQAHSGPGSSISLGDVLYVWANGYGGNGQTGDGGLALGGNINFSAGDGSSVTVASDVSLQAEGFAGNALSGVGDGGIGQGGNIQAFAVDGGTLGLAASLQEYVGGYGGYAEAGSGGLGQGGLGQLFTVAATATVGGYAYIDATGHGGAGLVVGGEGQGGTTYFSSAGGGSLSITGFASLSAGGRGGSAFGADGLGGDGGDGHGGHVEAFANNATLTFGSDLYLDADGEGGSAGDVGTSAGDGFGGDVYLQAVSGGSVGVTQGLFANADGLGGSGNFGVYSGNGTGGTITVISRDGTSSLTVTGGANLEADGYAGFSSECSSQCSAGGIGQGGAIFIASTGVLTGSTLDFQSTLFASADGYGGESAIIDFDSNTTVDGGDGLGGTVSLYANDGNSVSVAGDITLEAIGFGGYDPVGLVAGDGIGGIVQITSNSTAGNLITLGGSVVLDASGNGGGSGSFLNGTGGSALGGEARVHIFGGTATFGDLTLRTNATGGNADGGTGGNAQSGGSRVKAEGGAIIVGADLTLESISTGGDGDNGGDGIAFIGNDPRNTATSDARVVAQDGSVSVGGSTFLDVSAAGGSGANGGTGGDASAGYGTVHATNSDAGPSSIALGDLVIAADATGGSGGVGTNGGDAGDGGAGGSATGGFISVTAAAGNGQLTTNNVTVSASAFGGTGGDGGNSDGGTGGNGGAGGSATGGFINVGTESGPAEALGTNAGSATYATIAMLANATGGNGGAGSSGITNGIGGNGGAAVGGSSALLVRGSTVTAGVVVLDASATGGNGGISPTAPDGDGGDATTGTIGVVVTNRSGLPAQRGTLNATAIIGTTIATGGIGGSGNGQSLTQGGNRFLVANSDATIGNLFFSIDALGLAAGFAPDSIAVINGDVAMIGTFDFETTGQLSLFANNGTMTSDALVLTAGDFVYDTVNGPATNPGTYFANSATISTGNNFLTDANLNINNDFSLIAPGSIATGIFTTAGLLDLTGQAGSVHVERIDAGTSVSLLAGTFVDTGDIDAGSGVTITSQSGSINIGNVSAGGDVSLMADTSINGDDIITTGGVTAVTTNGDLGLNALQSGAGISLISGANVTLTGNASAVGDVSIDAVGSATTLDVTAGGSIDMAAGPLIDTGNLLAGGFIALSADTILGSNMTAGGFIDLFAGGPATIIVGDLSGAGVYLTSIGDITTGAIDSTLDVDLLSSSGSITTLDVTAATDITANAAGLLTMGNLIGQSIDLDAGTGISAGNVDAADFARLLSGGALTAGDVNALTTVKIEAAGNISFGNVAADDFDFDSANGGVTGGNIVAGTKASGSAQGAVILGDITAGPGLPLDDDFSVGISSATSITVGDVSGPGHVGLATFGDLTTGNLTGGDLVMTLVGGDISTGSITTAGNGRVYMADASMFETGGGGGDGEFDQNIVLALDPVPTGGSITIGGPVVTGLFQAAAGDNLTTQAITANQIDASAGGLATLNGLWQASDVELTSNDIDIGANGGIDAGNSGLIRLVSTNATQALIGDGITGTGYALTNAEFGRLSAGNVQIGARGDASAAIDMLIGDLDITGPLAGSTIDDPLGSVVFATGDPVTQVAGGVIRIVGDVTATGFTDTNALEFYTGRFELDAATGSISIFGSGTTLGGELGLYADQIHVASGTILDQLAVDPQYSGYQNDLNAPAAVQRPEGVLNAGVIWIESDNLQDILIQNTGTAETPAGFFANEVFVNDDFEIAGPPGSIDVVVNGQLITEAGTLTGVAVRDALVAGEDLSPFTANSTINGCLLTGACGVIEPPEPPEPPFPPGFTPTPGIQDEVRLIQQDLLPPPMFDNDAFIDDNDETTEEGETSPIEPPQPLFDTSGLGDDGDVDDPVSGSGNPALMETPPPTSNQEKQP